jgi:hypothetical protein
MKKTKVYEYLNKLKGTNETAEHIKNWAYDNRAICCCLEDFLELDCKYPKTLKTKAKQICKEVKGDCRKCLDTFFVCNVEEDRPPEPKIIKQIKGQVDLFKEE